MEGQYDVLRNGQHCGKVTVLRRGLYYQIHCRCMLPTVDIFRLQVQCGHKNENLGVLVPMDDRFGLDTKIPAKQLGEGNLTFSVQSKREPTAEHFVPILDEEPFGYISRLKESFLTIRDGQAGICIGKTQE